jgi:hypothetical protein
MAFLNAMAPQNMPRDLVRGCAMAIGNTLIKIYFKLNTLNNCKTVNNVIARTKCEMTDFPKAHVVTYRCGGGTRFPESAPAMLQQLP